MVETKKLKVPQEAKMVVQLAEVISKQVRIPYKTKSGLDRQRDRYSIRVNPDGKTATMVDFEHPAYKAYQVKRAEKKQAKKVVVQEKVARRLTRRSNSFTKKLERKDKTVTRLKLVITDLKTKLKAARNVKKLQRIESKKAKIIALQKEVDALKK